MTLNTSEMLNVQYLRLKGIKLENRNNRLWACCPKHSEKTASFTINPENGKFVCFGCGFKGTSLITLIMGIENVDKKTAVEKAQELFPQTYQKKNYGTDNKKEKLESVNEYLTNASKHMISYKYPENRDSIADFLGKKNIGIPEIEKYEIGIFKTDMLKWLGKKCLSFQDLKDLGYMKDNCFWLDNRISVPIIKNGKTIGFSLRLIGPTKPSDRKYINLVDRDVYKTDTWLYNLTNNTDSCIIVEGVFDAISTEARTGINTIAMLGTNNNSKERLAMLGSKKKIYLCFDNDTAGEKAIDDFYINSRKSIINSEIYVIQLEKDPDETETEELKTAIEKALPYWRYVVENLKKKACEISEQAMLNELTMFTQKIKSIGEAESSLLIRMILKSLIENISNDKVEKLIDKI